MIRRPIFLAGCAAAICAGCADPDAHARIEQRGANAIAAIQAAREIYCSVSPGTRRLFRSVHRDQDWPDRCATVSQEESDRETE